MLKVKASGVDKALRSARTIPKVLIDELDRETEKAAVRVINNAKKDAPVETGALKNSIDVMDAKLLERAIGSNLPYAQRQEYEHKTRRGYFRNNLYKEREPFREAIRAVLRKAGD